MTNAVEEVIAGDVRTVARLIRDIDDRVPELLNHPIEGGEFDCAVEAIMAGETDPHTGSYKLVFPRLGRNKRKETLV